MRLLTITKLKEVITFLNNPNCIYKSAILKEINF
jgi:hypothetical protein